MKVGKACQKLCRMEYNEKQMRFFRHLIDEEYRVHWCVSLCRCRGGAGRAPPIGGW